MASDRPRSKPGPRARIRNPAPLRFSDGEVHCEWLDGDDLDRTERSLRAYFANRNLQLRRLPGEGLGAPSRRIVALVQAALIETEAVWWSGRQDFVEVGRRPAPLPDQRGGWTRRYIGPTSPPGRRVNGCLWIDTSETLPLVKRWERSGRYRRWRVRSPMPKGMSPEGYVEMDRRPMPYMESQWRLTPQLDQFVETLLAPGTPRALHSGRPAYLAWATIADLLDVTPEKIQYFLGNFRRSRRRS